LTQINAIVCIVRYTNEELIMSVTSLLLCKVGKTLFLHFGILIAMMMSY